MLLFPAIDIYDGRCVRLRRGEFSDVTVYGKPEEIAVRWERSGARYLHVVDLNGARDGLLKNLDAVKRILRAVEIPVQLGGGIRRLSDVKLLLGKAGVTRVILGTAAATDPSLFDAAVAAYPGRVVCGVDVKDGRVAVKGWRESAEIAPVELGKDLKRRGADTVIYTDVSRDGLLSGIDADACRRFADETGLNAIASGGVSGIDDIKRLKAAGVYGAVLGKALYENKLDLTEALRIADAQS